MTRPGPKPGPPGSQRTARLVVRVTPADLEGYQAAAGRAGVSMGAWVRRMCGEWESERARVDERVIQALRGEVREAWQRGYDEGIAAAAEKEHGG